MWSHSHEEICLGGGGDSVWAGGADCRAAPRRPPPRHGRRQPVGVSSLVDPHHFANLDPHPDLDPHQSDKLDPDPHQFADHKPKCMEYETIWALFQKFERYLEARIWIRGNPGILFWEQEYSSGLHGFLISRHGEINAVPSMKRLDQGHLRGPETDMSRPGIEPGPPRWEASTLEKSHSNSLFNSYSKHLHMSPWQCLYAVFQIHDILVWIRIRIWICGSMPLTNGSGCRSGSYYFRHWPSGCQQKTNFFKLIFYTYYFLKVDLHLFSKIRSQKEVTKQ